MTESEHLARVMLLRSSGGISRDELAVRRGEGVFDVSQKRQRIERLLQDNSVRCRRLRLVMGRDEHGRNRTPLAPQDRSSSSRTLMPGRLMSMIAPLAGHIASSHASAESNARTS